MNTTLSKFMSIAITALVIVGLVFGVMVTTLKGEAAGYKTNVTDQEAPAVTTITVP